MIIQTRLSIIRRFECFAAFEVENYQKAEQFLHKVLHSTGVHTDKVHLKKEFYNLAPVVAYKNLKEMSELLGGHEIELNKDKAYGKEETYTKEWVMELRS